jgi:predicted GNAT family acetyltransferase
VVHRPEICEFSTILPDAKGTPLKAYLRYSQVSEGTLNLYTTVVPKDFEGRGIAKALANAAFEHCHQNNLKVTSQFSI